jgi:hypothetical protein
MQASLMIINYNHGMLIVQATDLFVACIFILLSFKDVNTSKLITCYMFSTNLQTFVALKCLKIKQIWAKKSQKTTTSFMTMMYRCLQDQRHLVMNRCLYDGNMGLIK